MPFDIWLTRCRSFEEIEGGVKGGQRVRRLLFGERSSLLNEVDFHAVMEPATAKLLPDGKTYWVCYPQQTEPWLATQFMPVKAKKGHVRLFLSYSNRRFIRNFADAFDLALRLADLLSARVFEEFGGREIHRGNVHRATAPDAPLTRFQAGVHQKIQDSLLHELKAPLEYPWNNIDTVPEYFGFGLVPHEGEEVPSYQELSNLWGLTGSITAQGESGLLFVSGEDKPTLHLQRFPRSLQLRPVWGLRTFAQTATRTLAFVDRLVSHNLGAMHYLDRPLTQQLRRDLGERSKGLGVEFYIWRSRL